MQQVWRQMMVTTRQPQKMAQACTSITPLERSDDIPRVECGQYPKSALALHLNDVRSPDQVTVAEPSILVFTVVTKHYAYARSGFDEGSAQKSGDRPVEALSLGFYDSR